MVNDMMQIEYVLALPNEQLQEFQQVENRLTLGDALKCFSLDEQARKLIKAPIYGVFNQIVDMNYVLQDGDRIEVYRPLQIDPKTARMIRAERKRKQLNSKK